MYGDPHSAFTFARMPIVIVAYSGGFGPTLSVLDRRALYCGARGLVLLDALYGGIDKFADWITYNRSTFFVSSYTPHIRATMTISNACYENVQCLTALNCGATTCRAWWRSCPPETFHTVTL